MSSSKTTLGIKTITTSDENFRQNGGFDEYVPELKEGTAVLISYSNGLLAHVIYDKNNERFEAQLRPAERYVVSKEEFLRVCKELGGNEHGIHCDSESAAMNSFLNSVSGIRMEKHLAREQTSRGEGRAR